MEQVLSVLDIERKRTELMAELRQWDIEAREANQHLNQEEIKNLSLEEIECLEVESTKRYNRFMEIKSKLQKLKHL